MSSRYRIDETGSGITPVTSFQCLTVQFSLGRTTMSRRILGASMIGALALLLAGFGNQADAGHRSRCCKPAKRCHHHRRRCCKPVKVRCCAPKPVKCCAPKPVCRPKPVCCKPRPTCSTPRPTCSAPAGKSYDGKSKAKKPAVKNAPAPPPEEKAPTPKKSKKKKKSA